MYRLCSVFTSNNNHVLGRDLHVKNTHSDRQVSLFLRVLSTTTHQQTMRQPPRRVLQKQHVILATCRPYQTSATSVNAYVRTSSEWKLPLSGRITYRHCRWPNLWTFSTRNIAFGDGTIDAGTAAPTSASVFRRYRNEPWTCLDTTPTNCQRLMKWHANGISGKITELMTCLHSNNFNIAAIQETKLTNKTKPLKTPGLAAVRLDRHKNKCGGLLMLIKDTIPFVDNTAALPQSA